MKKLLIGLFLGCLAQGAVADSDIQSLENVSQDLVKIRQQIESLHNEINYEKDTYKDQMRSYSNQKSDLDVRISRTDLNIKELERELKKLVDSRKAGNQGYEQLTPLLKNSIATIREVVSTSLPFKLEERSQALDDIETRLDANLITPNKAANQLWAFVEDELMLGKSTGIYNDTIKLNGEEKLVKVLRIGKIAMFYKTNDEHFGVIRKESGSWQQTDLDDSESVTQLEQLFESFSKNIRNGQYVTPDFLPRS